MTEDNNKKNLEKKGQKLAFANETEEESTLDDMERELDELLARSRRKGYELAEKYRQKSGQ